MPDASTPNLAPAITRLQARYPHLEPCIAHIQTAGDAIIASMEQGGCLFTCGNGGSAADAEHIVGELLKSFCADRPLPRAQAKALKDEFGEDGTYLAENLEAGLRAIALTSHPALSTAMSNDIAGDLAFAQQLQALGRAGDVVIGISTSGNATNVGHVMRLAKVMGITTIGLTGATGGQLAKLVDMAIQVPTDCTPDIQELHLPIYHALCIQIEDHFFCR